MTFHLIPGYDRATHRIALLAAQRRYQRAKNLRDPETPDLNSEDLYWLCYEELPDRWCIEAHCWTGKRIAVGVVRVQDGCVKQVDVIHGHLC